MSKHKHKHAPHSKTYRLTVLFITMLSIVGVDQITKFVARESLSVNPNKYLGDLFRLQLSENSGAFLSMGNNLDHETRFWFLVVGVGIFVAGIFWYLIRHTSLEKWNAISLNLVASGGIGNLIDRLTKETVTDFMNIGIGSIRTGVFNFADMVIMAGVFIFIYANLREQKDSKY